MTGLSKDLATFLREGTLLAALSIDETDAEILSESILGWMSIEYDRQVDEALAPFNLKGGTRLTLDTPADAI
tara:strand:- start:253 stop:468 length:216 start_codon:yes stop_codon:yes gene_type:complete